MSIPVSVERSPGLMSTLGYPESVLHVRGFIDSAPELAGTEFVDSLRQYAHKDSRAEEFLGFSLKEIARELQGFLRRRRLSVIAEATGEVPVTVHELHLPRVTGCRASLSTVTSRERHAGFTVDILGIGGGDEFTLSFEAGYSIDTSDRCIRVVHSVPVVWELVEVDSGDTTAPVRFVRLKNVMPSCDRIISETADADPCTGVVPDSPDLAEKREFSLTGDAEHELKTSLKVLANQAWSSTLGLNVSSLGLSAQVTMKSTQSFATNLEYTLVSGYNYLAWRQKNRPTWFWGPGVKTPPLTA
jgi:hypothetical protein